MPFWSREPAPPPISPNEFASSSSGADSPSSSHNANSSTIPIAGAAPSPPPSKIRTREEQADSELATLLSELAAEQTSADAAESRASTLGAAFRSEARETVYPTEMSCITAFDELYYCYSLGGQFNNVYRYGTYRDCSEKGADFRFCMKTKMYGAAARRQMVLSRYKEKAAKYKTGLSSEDVWEIRTTPLTE